jgi:hypothetical protein
MPAQAPTTVKSVPGDELQTTPRQQQAREATQQGLDAALAAQRALGSGASVRDARPNSPAHSPNQR